MSPSPLPRLTDAEFEIMEIVWEEGETTVNHVWETINRKRKALLSRTTTLVQMNRLEEKKWLKHRTVGRTFLYSATRKKGRDARTPRRRYSQQVLQRFQLRSCAVPFQERQSVQRGDPETQRDHPQPGRRAEMNWQFLFASGTAANWILLTALHSVWLSATAWRSSRSGDSERPRSDRPGALLLSSCCFRCRSLPGLFPGLRFAVTQFKRPRSQPSRQIPRLTPPY